MSGRNNNFRGRGSSRGRGRGDRYRNKLWGNAQNNDGGRSEKFSQRSPFRRGRNNNYRPPAVRFDTRSTRNKSTINNNNNTADSNKNYKRKVEGSSVNNALANISHD